ncbi:MAG: hypothetical protein N3C57_02955 [Aquificaceae bacterium]|nr:hypothetical protein [Aquificaceae bacterium]
MKVTDNKTHDSQCAVELVENSVRKVQALGGSVKEVIADTGVGSHEIFRHLASIGNKASDKGQERCSDNRQQSDLWGSEWDKER